MWLFYVFLFFLISSEHCRNNALDICDKRTTIWISNQFPFLNNAAAVLSGHSFITKRKAISQLSPVSKRSLGFETQPTNHPTRVSICCCRDPKSMLRFLGVQCKVTAISPLLLALQSALCPRRVELSSVLSCMGTRALRQMQYFPEYFCQNPSL